MSIREKEKFCNPTEERALLSYLFKDIDYFYSVKTVITEECFLYPEHKLLFIAISALVNSGVKVLSIDLVTNYILTNGIIDSVGGLDYVQAISSMNLPDENFKIYLYSVADTGNKFKLHSILNKSIKDVEYNAKLGKDSDQLIGNVESKIMDLSNKSKFKQEPINLSDGLREYIEELRLNPVEQTGLSTGYPILDKQIDGLIPGTLTIFCARKKMGKSALLTNIAVNSAYVLQEPVLYVDTELSFKEWRTRALAIISRVPERTIKHGKYTDEEYREIIKAVEIIEKGKLFHEYMPGFTVDKIVASFNKYKIKENIGLGIFDYLKEPQMTQESAGRKEYQVLGDVTTRLKDLSGQLDIPMITAVQLNRKHDIADSDKIARYGDIIIFWEYRTEEEIEDSGDKAGSHKLIIKDTRRGGGTPDEGITYWFFKETLSIKEVSPSNQPIITGEQVINDKGALIKDFDDLLE